jgi:hypothetical protein
VQVILLEITIFFERTAKALPLFLLDDEKKQSGGPIF